MQSAKAKGQILKEFFTLMIPIFIGNLFTYGTAFADHLFASGLGSTEGIGIFASNQVFLILQFFVNGIEAGVAILGSGSEGEGNKSRYRKVLFTALGIGLIISLLTTIICFLYPKGVLTLISGKNNLSEAGTDFLKILSLSFPIFTLTRILISASKATGAAESALISPLVALFANVYFSRLFLSLSVGAVGIAYATLIARGAELLSALLLYLKAARRADVSPLPLLPKNRDTGAILRAFAPILLGQAAWAGSNLLSTVLMSRDAALAFSVTASFSALAYTLMNAASSAIGILVSRSVGEGDEKQVLRVAKTGERLFILFAALASLIIYIFKEEFAGLYGLGGEASKMTIRLLTILSFVFFFNIYSAATLFGIVKSAGDLRFVLGVDIFGFLFITLPLSLAFYYGGLDPAALFFALRVEHIIKCPIACLKLRRGNYIKGSMLRTDLDRIKDG